MKPRHRQLLHMTVLLILGTLPGQLLLADSVLTVRGFGLLQLPVDARGRALGGAGMALGEENFAMVNPAVVGLFDRAGISGLSFAEYRSVEDPLRDQNLRSFEFPFLHLVFPITGHFTFAAGYYEFTDFDFVLQESVSVEAERPVRTFTSDGGIAVLQAGGSYRLGEQLWLGLGVDFYTGSQSLALEVAFPEAASVEEQLLDFRTNSRVRYTGVGATLGLLYQLSPRVSLGLTYGRVPKLDMEETLHSITVPTPGGLATQQIPPAGKLGEVRLADRFSAGVALRLSPQWLVASDFHYGHWSAFAVNGQPVAGFEDMLSVSLGTEFTLEEGRWLFLTPGTPLRLGGTWRRLPRRVGGETVSEYGVSMGLGGYFGNRQGRTDVAVELGKRGALERNGLSESYLRVTLSFSAFEKWLPKQKGRRSPRQ